LTSNSANLRLPAPKSTERNDFVFNIAVVALVPTRTRRLQTFGSCEAACDGYRNWQYRSNRKEKKLSLERTPRPSNTRGAQEPCSRRGILALLQRGRGWESAGTGVRLSPRMSIIGQQTPTLHELALEVEGETAEEVPGNSWVEEPRNGRRHPPTARDRRPSLAWHPRKATPSLSVGQILAVAAWLVFIMPGLDRVRLPAG